MESTVKQPEMRLAAEQSFNVVVRDDLSLDDLVQLHTAGESVVRSPHVGNMAGYNMALGGLGLRIVAYDRMRAKDATYRPAEVLAAGHATAIAADADREQLVAHVTTNEAFTLEETVIPIQAGESLVSVHQRGMQAALLGSKATVETMSEYLRAWDGRVFNEVARTLGNSLPWKRRVTRNGTIQEVVDPQGELQKYGVFQSGHTLNEKAGLLPPNEMNVLLFGIYEALRHQSDTIFHLSGPAMVNYIQEMAPTLDALYSRFRAVSSLRTKLPEQLNFVIVPTAAARFVVPAGQEYTLDNLLESYRYCQLTEKEITARKRGVAALQLPKEVKSQQLQALTSEMSDVKNKLAQAAAECPWIFASPGDSHYLTQYDALLETRQGNYPGFYLHDFARTQPLREVAQTYKYIESTYRKAQK